MSDLPASGPKKRGAQTGNWNRLKHGYYSKRLRGLDAEGARALDRTLEDELALMRMLLREFVVRALATGDLAWLERALDLAGRTAVRIATVARVQQVVASWKGDERPAAVIERVLIELGEDL